MREQLARYYSSVTATDTLLGDFRALVQKYVRGDALFIYTSDHGAQLPFSKWDLYDAGTRLPFIAVWPGHLPPGKTSDATICLPDLLPTLIEVGGGQVPDGLDGQSFAGVLHGTTTTHRDRTFATQSGDANCNVYPSRSLRMAGWKFIWNLHPEFQHHTFISRYAEETSGLVYWRSWLEAAKTDPSAAAKVARYTVRPAEELYDLTADPHEQHNLAADPQHAERLAAMRAELKAWMKSQDDQETVFGTPLMIGEPVTLLSPEQVQKQLRGQNEQRGDRL
jgi:N-sulfoglucosamine sulfohydrolase